MSNDKKSNTIDRILEAVLFCLVIFLFSAIIFFFSNQSGSQSHSFSKSISASIVTDWNNMFRLHLDEESFQLVTKVLDSPIRKLAHVIEYFLLGFGVYGTIFLVNRNKNRFIYLLLTLLVVILIACLDEYNQFFSGGRGSSMCDVLIDTIGGCMGIYLVIVVHDLFVHIMHLFTSLFSGLHDKE